MRYAICCYWKQTHLFFRPRFTSKPIVDFGIRVVWRCVCVRVRVRVCARTCICEWENGCLNARFSHSVYVRLYVQFIRLRINLSVCVAVWVSVFYLFTTPYTLTATYYTIVLNWNRFCIHSNSIRVKQRKHTATAAGTATATAVTMTVTTTTTQIQLLAFHMFQMHSRHPSLQLPYIHFTVPWQDEHTYMHIVVCTIPYSAVCSLHSFSDYAIVQHCAVLNYKFPNGKRKWNQTHSKCILYQNLKFSAVQLATTIVPVQYVDVKIVANVTWRQD